MVNNTFTIYMKWSIFHITLYWMLQYVTDTAFFCILNAVKLLFSSTQNNIIIMGKFCRIHLLLLPHKNIASYAVVMNKRFYGDINNKNGIACFLINWRIYIYKNGIATNIKTYYNRTAMLRVSQLSSKTSDFMGMIIIKPNRYKPNALYNDKTEILFIAITPSTR